MNYYSIIARSLRKHGLKETLKKISGFARASGVGGGNALRVYWHYNSDEPNFGDIINPWLVEKLASKKVIRAGHLCFREHFFIIGTVLTRANKRSVVWGSGGQTKGAVKSVYAVRGPLTRKRLLRQKLNCPEIYGDPALLCPLFFFPNKKKKWSLGVVPHLVELETVREWYSEEEGILVVDVRNSVENVISDIVSCEKIISSSLHGIIVAHAYGIPAAWAVFVPDSTKQANIGTDKFIDYFLSVDLPSPYCPILYGETRIESPVLVEYVEQRLTLPTDKKIKAMQKGLLENCPFPVEIKGEILERLDS